ncbi:dTDP-4-dehydrorhamnose 3,5-epimerase [Rhodococcus sp. 06-235-1A]|uniref:dTDP-4-dehydrorhamnose 3,5-epimerase family protein n=1 Tax=Rhodococcus sp. 06-235-1A TaxID=2022508 RepID=UPI000B9B4C37|nr:dTDP-4-dehydrorhamnose 3,5-epimerase family protein [Rhodococcus sp. 06-235-1A]OZC94890.1 dTDP-4-dehydrorhamnose 3,5-epimerase [Rhodococcus sp. 06-235-1A]
MADFESIGGIEGLGFFDNYFHESADGTLTTTIASEGPGISDVVTHSPDFSYNHYGIHVAQSDRLTFFGPLDQKITGYFVDCRLGSPTLHKFVKIVYSPDPRRRLHIDRGIAHTFDGLENVVTRDEPLWFLSRNNPDYNIANDVVNVGRDVSPEDFPSIQPNQYPIPRAAYEFMLMLQHHSMKSMQRYPTRFPVTLNGERRYVNLRPKEGAVA